MQSHTHLQHCFASYLIGSYHSFSALTLSDAAWEGWVSGLLRRSCLFLVAYIYTKPSMSHTLHCTSSVMCFRLVGGAGLAYFISNETTKQIKYKKLSL